ncbi:RHS repeat domain-containing protein [Pseudomonas sp. NPDC098747]|uniref:RHS repeat domain-containing protein n=1 Tax=Pseudomonas sp. NPDC098747 TaxID=3364487 RepID=UPI00383A9B75
MTTVADITTARRCQGTPTLSIVDNRALVVRTVQYNRTHTEDVLDELVTRQTYTERGQLASSIDPRLFDEQRRDPSVLPNLRYLNSLSGQPLAIRSQDNGDRVQLPDAEGGIVLQWNSRDLQLRRTFDTLHRLTLVSEQPTGGPRRISERMVYGDGASSVDANCRGQLLSHHNPAGVTVYSSYSISGELLSSRQQFLRDAVLLSDWSGNDPVSWEGDLAPQAYTTRWSHNAQEMEVQRTDAKGNRQRQRYNIAGQLAQSDLTLPGQPPQTLLHAIDYNAAGQVLREEAGNGVITEYDYEPQTRRLSFLTTRRPSTADGRTQVLQALSYRYDPVGNLLDTGDTTKAIRHTRNQKVAAASSYDYDALYQLCRASGRENANAGSHSAALPSALIPLWQDAGELSNYTRRYHYDRGGNLTTVAHQGLHSHFRQMVVASTSNRALEQTGELTSDDVDGGFDACGNLTRLGAAQALAWDSRNQLLRTTQVARSGATDDTEVYWYANAGQRATKLRTTLTGGTTRSVRVRYLPGLELRQTEQTVGGSTTPTEILHVINIGAAGRQSVSLLHWELGRPKSIANDQVRYSLSDSIGSSVLELDQQADILTWEEYFPYGGTAVWSARNETDAAYKYVRYSGKERDATGLYYYGYRYYAPWLGRWLNPDPAGTVDGLNLFCMVCNNPITQQDADGLFSFADLCCCGGGDATSGMSDALINSNAAEPLSLAPPSRAATPSVLQIVNDDGTDLSANPFAGGGASASSPFAQVAAPASALPANSLPLEAHAAIVPLTGKPIRYKSGQNKTKPFYDLVADSSATVFINGTALPKMDDTYYSLPKKNIKQAMKNIKSKQREYIKSVVHQGLHDITKQPLEERFGGEFKGFSITNVNIISSAKSVVIYFKNEMTFSYFAPTAGRMVPASGTLNTSLRIEKSMKKTGKKLFSNPTKTGVAGNKFSVSLDYNNPPSQWS